MRFWLSLSIAFVSACGTSGSEADGKNSSPADGGPGFDAASDTTDTGDINADEAGDAAATPFVLDEGGYEYLEFRLKEDTCGIDSVASVTSLMPSSYGLTTGAATDRFVLSSSDQGTETGCTVGALDPESGLAYFACDTFREGYRSPYGDGFDMEVSFSGEVTEEQLIAGPLTIVLHCMVGDFCEDLAQNGVDFPCTVGGDLLLQPTAQ